MNFAVVIVTYNRLNLLKECINNVLIQSYPVNKVVIVNNSSTDGTKEFLERFTDDNKFDVYNSDTNYGGAWGFYKGLQLMENYDFDYVLLIDDDAIIENNFFELMNKNIKKYPNYSSYSSTVYVNNNIDVGHRMHLENKLFVKFKPVHKDLYSEDCFECDTATFCGLLIKRDILIKIGLPEEDYFIWFDDMEYSLRILKYTKILNINNAVINHKTVAPFAQAPITWKNFYGERNYLLMVKKHFSRFSYFYIIVRKLIKLGLLKVKCIFGNKDCEYNYKLLYCAIKDALNNNKGINKEYLPG